MMKQALIIYLTTSLFVYFNLHSVLPSKKIPCPLKCDITFTSNNLAYHHACFYCIRNNQTEKVWRYCATPKQLKLHKMNNLHVCKKKIKLFKKILYELEYKNNHNVQPEKKRISCPVSDKCSKKFRTKNIAYNHARFNCKYNNKKIEIKCPLKDCPWRYSCPAQLAKHFRLKHPEQPETLLVEPIKTLHKTNQMTMFEGTESFEHKNSRYAQQEKNCISCPISDKCPKKFNTKKIAYNHAWFNCKYNNKKIEIKCPLKDCPWRYSCPIQLAKHFRRHHPEQPETLLVEPMETLNRNNKATVPWNNE